MDVLQNNWPVLSDNVRVIAADALVPPRHACPQHSVIVLTYRRQAGGFPGGSVVKNLPANAGDKSLIPRLRRSPGGGNSNPL